MGSSVRRRPSTGADRERRPAGTLTGARNPPVPPFVMDRPALHTFVREVAEYERLGELAEALPTGARVSDAALPVVLAALHERLERPLVCLLPEDADARD